MDETTTLFQPHIMDSVNSNLYHSGLHRFALRKRYYKSLFIADTLSCSQLKNLTQFMETTTQTEVLKNNYSDSHLCCIF
jgi:hypothetical protein